MKLKIISKQYNPLLKRQEVTFAVKHEQTGGTPPRLEVRKKLAEILKTDINLIYINKMETKTGTMTAVGTANAYDAIEQAKKIEPKHIIARNMPPEKPEEKAAVEEEKKKEEEKKEK